MTARYTITGALGRRGQRLRATRIAPREPAREVTLSRAPQPEAVRWFAVDLRGSIGIRHPNLVELIDIAFTPDDEACFIVTEHVDGCDLATLVDGGRRLAVAHALHVAIACCAGLAHAHGLGHVHGEVWPGAILLSVDGQVKLADLAIAKLLRVNHRTASHPRDRRFGYIAPDLLPGTGFDHRADLFSLGVVLWELLAGRALFAGDTDLATLERVNATEIPAIDGLDPGLDAIVRRALARDPDHRCATAAELGAALAGCGIAPTPPDLPRQRAAAPVDLARAQWEVDQMVSIR